MQCRQPSLRPAGGCCRRPSHRRSPSGSTLGSQAGCPSGCARCRGWRGVGGADAQLVPRRTSSKPECRADDEGLDSCAAQDLSTEAQTTTWVQRSAVTKIFTVQTISSSPPASRPRRRLESEPNCGSDGHGGPDLPKRSSCSSVATAATAALPRPWYDGQVRPTPQQVSMTFRRRHVAAVLHAGVFLYPHGCGGAGWRPPTRAPPTRAAMGVEFDRARALEVVLVGDGAETRAAWCAWLAPAFRRLGSSRLSMIFSCSRLCCA